MINPVNNQCNLPLNIGKIKTITKLGLKIIYAEYFFDQLKFKRSQH